MTSESGARLMNDWDFPILRRNDDEDSSIAGDNFRRESAKFEKLFNREFQQNTLDARKINYRNNEPATAKVIIRIVNKDDIDSVYFENIVRDIKPRLKASDGLSDCDNYETPTAIILEEFNTTGLTGITNNSRAQGENERWSAFFFGEGKVTKSRGNGRAGQGKITYHLASSARCVLVNSVRDGEKSGQLFGKAVFDRTYTLGVKDHWFKRKAYWCKDSTEEQPLPQDSTSEVNDFRRAFSLIRQDGQTGTSFVIPYPDPSLTEKGLIKATLADFFYAIHRGRLEIEINGIQINQSNLRDRVTEHLDEDTDPSTTFLDFVEEFITMHDEALYTLSDDWQESTELLDNYFEPSVLTELRDRFLGGDVIGVRFPLVVSYKNDEKLSTYFDVFVQQPENLLRTEECYIRSDLIIGEEKTLRHLPGKFLGATIAEDSVIAEFLGDTEESSHMRFNSRELKAARKYRNIVQTLRLVRQAMPRLARLLAGLSSGLQEDLLMDWLSVSSAQGKKMKTKTKKKSKEKSNNTEQGDNVFYSPKPKYVEVSDISGGLHLSPGRSTLSNITPVQCAIELAYDRVPGTGNPFDKYHVFEFDLTNSSMSKNLSSSGITIQSIEPNKIYFTIEKPIFELSLSGFSNEKRLRSRVEVKI